MTSSKGAWKNVGGERRLPLRDADEYDHVHNSNHNNFEIESTACSEDSSVTRGTLDSSYSSVGTKDKEMLSVPYRMRLRKLSRFWTVKLCQLLCVAYIMILTFSTAPLGLVDPNTGKIIDVTSAENTKDGVILVNGDFRPVVATTTFQMVCLAMSRMSAFSMYPVMVAVFLSKCKATISFFNGTPLSMYMIRDSHGLHAYAGKFIAFDVWIHTVFHLLRWFSQGNIHLLWKSRCGFSGLLVVYATPFITLPMMFLKDQIPYEIRKGLHYLFYVFAVGMCFHVPVSGIPNGGFIAPVLGFCICLYTLDALYITLFMTEKIETTIFQVLPSGVKMSMDVSQSFQRRMNQGGFVYVCLPWVDRNQWHAFSLFENPDVPNRSEVFILNTGDWTRAVHRALRRDTVRPVWVQGPFESPYNDAILYDNQILVASGIGVTPALSVIRAHRDTRRINLIWAVRDATMLEFFLEHMYLHHDGWNLIFYTGKAPLNPALEESNTNVRVIKRRPDLHTLIPNIIFGIESKTGLPEKYVPGKIARVKRLLIERTRELDRMEDMSTGEKLRDLTALARKCGFLFTELVKEFGFDDFDEEWEHVDIEGGGGGGHLAGMATGPGAGNRIGSHHVSSSTRRGNGRGSSRRGHGVASVSNGTAAFDGNEVLRRIRESGDAGGDPHQTRRRGTKRRGGSSGRNNSRRGHRQDNNSLLLLSRNMSRVMTAAFKPWEDCCGDGVARDYVKCLEKETVLSTWGILYCGGSKHIRRALKHISEEYHVALNSESFDW